MIKNDKFHAFGKQKLSFSNIVTIKKWIGFSCIAFFVHFSFKCMHSCCLLWVFFLFVCLLSDFTFIFLSSIYISHQQIKINKIQKGRYGSIIDRCIFFVKTYQDRMPIDLLPETMHDYRYYTKRRNCCR